MNWPAVTGGPAGSSASGGVRQRFVQRSDQATGRPVPTALPVRLLDCWSSATEIVPRFLQPPAQSPIHPPASGPLQLSFVLTDVVAQADPGGAQLRTCRSMI